MTRKTMSNLLALLGLLIALAVSFGGTLVYGQTMNVNVTGLRSSQGVVHVLVYSDARAFSSGSVSQLAGYAAFDASASDTSVMIHGVQPGQYAVIVHHDENANDTFDYNGDVPLEGWGYSNNVGQDDLPEFSAATFEFGSAQPGQTITMIYVD